MTIVTSFMRGAERHSALVDIASLFPRVLSEFDFDFDLALSQGTIRMLMSIGGLVPLPSDALVSPVTFKVQRRNLRGILVEFDAKETGNRELSGEWVVGRKTWQRMQTDWKAANKSDPALNKSSAATPVSIDTPLEGPTPLKRKERVILYIHGGSQFPTSSFGNS